MRVPIGKFTLLFNIIQTETLQGSSVLVLVAFDVDALAGARLLKVRPQFSALRHPKYIKCILIL